MRLLAAALRWISHAFMIKYPEGRDPQFYTVWFSDLTKCWNYRGLCASFILKGSSAIALNQLFRDHSTCECHFKIMNGPLECNLPVLQFLLLPISLWQTLPPFCWAIQRGKYILHRWREGVNIGWNNAIYHCILKSCDPCYSHMSQCCTMVQVQTRGDVILLNSF